MSDGPRVVFERPRFSRWGVRVSMSVLIAIALGVLVSSWSIEGKVIIGTFAGLAAPFLLLVWFRVAQRVELDESGITIVGRLGRRHTPWVKAKNISLPTYNWNEAELAMPADLADVEPLFEVTPPAKGREPGRLDAFLWQHYGDDRIRFRLYQGLLDLRTSEPRGDWSRQLATVFRAHERYNRPRPAALPVASVED